MVIRTTLALLPILLTACIEGPPSQPGTAVDDVLSLAPNTAIAAGCSGDAVTLTWTVEAHPRVERYDAVVRADGTASQDPGGDGHREQ